MASGLNILSDPWIREYELAEESVQDISASIQERNLKYPSGGNQASRITAQARRKLGSLGTAIQTLQYMLTDSKSSGGLTENERNRRRDLIRTLESRRENLIRGLARGDTDNKTGLFGSGAVSNGPVRETEKTARLENRELLQLQDRIIKEQDHELQHIENSVDTTKHVAGAIHEELTLHDSLLTGLENEADTTHNRLSVAKKHIKLIMETASEWKWWSVSFILVVLLVIAIAFAFHAVI